MINYLIQHRYLFLQILQREISQRYRGTQFGLLWVFLLPISMLLIYTFVFGMVMRVKWGVEGQDNIGFGLILFAGLLCHTLLAEVLTGSVSIIKGNVQYVKKVVFPLEILTLVKVANAFIHMLFGVLILLVIFLFTGNTIPWTISLMPLVMLPFLIFIVGASYFISVLGVYLPDFGQVVGVLMTMLLFLGPIVYPFHVIPEGLQVFVLWLNPLTIIVEQLRAVMLFGQMPDWQLLGGYSVFALMMLGVGYGFFQKNRYGFADVI